MTNPMITIHDLETNQIIEREMTAEEMTQWELDKTQAQAKDEAEAMKATEKAALLERLGITADEAVLLFS